MYIYTCSIYIYIVDILFFCLRKCFWDVKPPQSDSYENQTSSQMETWRNTLRNRRNFVGSGGQGQMDGWMQPGWWFGCHLDYFPTYWVAIIIPIDELLFFRGVVKKPPTSNNNDDMNDMNDPDFVNAFLQGYFHGHHHGTWRSMASLVGIFMLLPQSMICERGTTLW